MAFNTVKVFMTKSPPTEQGPNYDGPEYSITVLQKGHIRKPGYAPFQVDTIYEKDIKVVLRDGKTIRADIFRPAIPGAKIPVLMAWSPYGKTGRGIYTLDHVQGRAGVPRDKNSGYEKFEALDPATWTARGYAIANIDIRGSWDSEGDLHYWGTQDGRDGYDTVEQLAKLEWCNGKVALMGNSWLAMSQWFIAAERPPHLCCIAPMEGASDVYRELLCRGGVPTKAFMGMLPGTLFGRNSQEDIIGMLDKYPSMNKYWEDKRAAVHKIRVPLYAVASYSTGLHTYGSFRGFLEAQSSSKWLRVHATQEWHDIYKDEVNDELQEFFDRYTKGIENGWENTPRVRMAIYRFNKEPLINVPFAKWPFPSKQQTLYLRGDETLQDRVPSDGSILSYKSDVPFMQMDSDVEELSFTHIFDSPAHIVGSARAKLFMSCPDHNDLDVWVQLRKADKEGHLLHQLTIPPADLGIADDQVELLNSLRYLGPSGALRASYRAIEPKTSTLEFPEHDYYTQNLVEPGRVVELEIGLWQTGMAFEAGERLILKISGHPMTLAEYPQLRGKESLDNKGFHKLHMGGEHPSSITIPLLAL